MLQIVLMKQMQKVKDNHKVIYMIYVIPLEVYIF
jgi:hypothetical protein